MQVLSSEGSAAKSNVVLYFYAAMFLLPIVYTNQPGEVRSNYSHNPHSSVGEAVIQQWIDKGL